VAEDDRNDSGVGARPRDAYDKWDFPNRAAELPDGQTGSNPKVGVADKPGDIRAPVPKGRELRFMGEPLSLEGP
jgi:hypothetical protein